MTWILWWALIIFIVIRIMAYSAKCRRHGDQLAREAARMMTGPTPTSHPVQTKHGWQYLDEGKPPVSLDDAYPIYTVKQVMEGLPDYIRDMLRLAGKPCPAYGRQVQGHLWEATPQALWSEGKRWRCRSCREVCRTERAARETGTFYQQQILAIENEDHAASLAHHLDDLTVRARHDVTCDGDIPGSPGCICEPLRMI